MQAPRGLIHRERPEGPLYKSPHRQGFYTSRTCVTLFTLLPATPLQRKPVPAGKVAGVILSVCACGRRGCYVQGIRPGSSKPSSFPQGPPEEDNRGLQRPSVMVTGPQQQNPCVGGSYENNNSFYPKLSLKSHQSPSMIYPLCPLFA